MPRRPIAKAVALAIAFCGSTFGQLNQNCTVSVLNRTIKVNADGSWVLPNIPANFGQVKARATCVQNGITTFGESDFFSVPANGAVNLPDIQIGNTTLIPIALTVNPSSPSLTIIGQTVQLTVQALYTNSSTKDVSAASTGTNYTTSNSAIASITADGLLTAVASGPAVIQATNDGSTGIISVRVILAGADTDGDGIPDSAETSLGLSLDPRNPIDAQEDFDRDGLTNLREYQLGTDLRKADTDDDGLPDGAEVDTYHTNPLVTDTDGEGIPDGIEIQTGTDPNNPLSYDLSRALLSLSVSPTIFTLTVNTISPQASQQLTVTGMLIDRKTTIDLTSTQRRTAYGSSNLSVCNFGSPDGRVFAGSNGSCAITVQNSTFSATATGTVTSFGPTPLSFVNIPGYANNVDVTGNYAYVAAGSAGLQIVNVSNKLSPAIVASRTLPGNANDVRVAGGFAYVAAGSGGLQIVDISNPLAPVIRGALTGGDAWDVIVKNGLAYIANGSGGLRIVNVADPVNPQLAGSLSLPGTAKGVDVDVSRNLAVVAAGSGGLHVVDIGNPSNPRLASTLGGGDVRDVALSGNFALLADFSRSFTSVDLTNASVPVLRGSTPQSLGGLLQDVKIVGNYAFGADVFFVNGVPIVDITTPQTPIPRAILNFGNFRDDNGTGIAADLSFVYMTASQDIGENGSSGSTRLYIGQYQQIVDTGSIPPVVQITSPLSGPLIQESTITISANATDDVAVASVALLVNGQAVFANTAPPYQTSYVVPSNATTLTFGASALDFGNNTGNAPPVTLPVIPDPLTSAHGRVLGPEGVPFSGAAVTTLARNGTTAPDGTFTLAGLPTIRGPIVVTAVATQAGIRLAGFSSSVAPLPNGAIEVGDIRLAPKPFITSITPTAVLADSNTLMTITGENLLGSTFEFIPSGITVLQPSINPTGTSATLTAAVNGSVSGNFTLIGTNPAGSSDPTPTSGFVRNSPPFNTIVVPGSSPIADPDKDGATNQQEISAGTNPLNPDTDGDGAIDGLELALGSDARDQSDLPKPYSSGLVFGRIFSILNGQNPSTATSGTARFVSSRVFSALNSQNPSIGLAGTTKFVSSRTFSMLNGQNPSIGLVGSTKFVSSRTFSMLNGQNPSIGLVGSTKFVSSRTFSMLNGQNPSIGLAGSLKFVSSRTFSILNSRSPFTPGTISQFTSSRFFSILNTTGAGLLSAESLTNLSDTRRAIAERVAQPWLSANSVTATSDADGDSLRDADEAILGTDPRNPDTDRDGYPDGLENALGSDPLDFNSIPAIHSPRFVISPFVSIQTSALQARTVLPVAPVMLRRP